MNGRGGFLAVAMAIIGAGQAPALLALTSPAPPPPLVRTVERTRTQIPIQPVKVTMSIGSTILWSGTLNVGGNRQARVSLSEPVANDAQCDDNDYNDGMREFSLTLSATRMSPQQNGYWLNATYSRPSTNMSCTRGTRSVSINQRFDWAGSNSLTFEGDGGLKVTLQRN